MQETSKTTSTLFGFIPKGRRESEETKEKETSSIDIAKIKEQLEKDPDGKQQWTNNTFKAVLLQKIASRNSRAQPFVCFLLSCKSVERLTKEDSFYKFIFNLKKGMEEGYFIGETSFQLVVYNEHAEHYTPVDILVKNNFLHVLVLDAANESSADQALLKIIENIPNCDTYRFEPSYIPNLDRLGLIQTDHFSCSCCAAEHAFRLSRKSLIPKLIKDKKGLRDKEQLENEYENKKEVIANKKLEDAKKQGLDPDVLRKVTLVKTKYIAENAPELLLATQSLETIAYFEQNTPELADKTVSSKGHTFKEFIEKNTEIAPHQGQTKKQNRTIMRKQKSFAEETLDYIKQVGDEGIKKQIIAMDEDAQRFPLMKPQDREKFINRYIKDQCWSDVMANILGKHMVSMEAYAVLLAKRVEKEESDKLYEWAGVKREVVKKVLPALTSAWETVCDFGDVDYSEESLQAILQHPIPEHIKNELTAASKKFTHVSAEDDSVASAEEKEKDGDLPQVTHVSHKESNISPSELKEAAIRHFKGEGGKDDLRKYECWYSTQALEALVFANESKQDIVRYVLLPQSSERTTSFVKQMQQLNMLKNQLKKAVAFIATEPGIAETHHFIFGLIFGKNLFIINPIGKTKHKPFYERIAQVKDALNLENIYFSCTPIQRKEEEPGLVSCGPICIEFMRHFVMDPNINIQAILEAGQSQWESEEFKDDGENIAYRYQWVDVDTSKLLPEKLQSLRKASLDGEYQAIMENIRKSHLELLEAGSFLPRDEQGLITQLILGEVPLDKLDGDSRYKKLSERTVREGNENRVESSIPQAARELRM